MAKERWVYGFRSAGTRRLTEEEIGRLRSLERKCWAKGSIRGVATVVGFLAALALVAVAADGYPLAWAGLLVDALLVTKALTKANESEYLARLYRRAIRTGFVEQFEFEGAEDAVQVAYERALGEEGGLPFWDGEERFLDDLAKQHAGEVHSFESVGRDGVVLYVEGTLTKRPLSLFVIRVPASGGTQT